MHKLCEDRKGGPVLYELIEVSVLDGNICDKIRTCDMNLICIVRYSKVKPVNKGHPRERWHMVFIDKWTLFGGHTTIRKSTFFLFY